MKVEYGKTKIFLACLTGMTGYLLTVTSQLPQWLAITIGVINSGGINVLFYLLKPADFATHVTPTQIIDEKLNNKKD